MKTLDEAVEVLYERIQGPGDAQRKLPVLVDRVSRYSDLIKRAVENPEVQDMMTAVLCAAPDLRSAVTSAFINGLIVGIEMEKQESGVCGA